MQGDDLYDVLLEVSNAQHARPPELSDIDPRALSALQRCLIAIDGTVTTFLQAYTLERIHIQRLSQTTEQLDKDDEWLDARAGTEVAIREVLIEGVPSNTLYLYAHSRIVLDRLPEAVRRRLEIQGEGLGRVLNDHRLETRRELLWFGREHVPSLPPAVAERTGPDFITRTYRIIGGGKPLVVITERMPASLEPPLPGQRTDSGVPPAE